MLHTGSRLLAVDPHSFHHIPRTPRHRGQPRSRTRNPANTTGAAAGTERPKRAHVSHRRENDVFEAIEENIDDIAGIRVICSFESDVYLIAESLLRQTDVRLIERVDYIAHPKPSGYRSLHLVIAIPIFLYDEMKTMKVEVQLRTMAMDMWASLEHKLAYKKAEPRDPEAMRKNLLECAELSAHIDKLMTETSAMLDEK